MLKDRLVDKREMFNFLKIYIFEKKINVTGES